MIINSAEAFKAYVQHLDDQKFKMPTELDCMNCFKKAPVQPNTYIHEVVTYCEPCNFQSVYDKIFLYKLHKLKTSRA